MRISDWSSDVCSSDLGETITYAELDRRSARTAKALLATGVGKGTRVGLLAPDGELMLTTFYAALRIGALVTPISTLATPPELAHILATSDVQVLIGARRFLRRDFVERSEEHTSELQSLMRISYAVFCLKKKIKQQCHEHTR